MWGFFSCGIEYIYNEKLFLINNLYSYHELNTKILLISFIISNKMPIREREREKERKREREREKEREKERGQQTNGRTCTPINRVKCPQLKNDQRKKNVKGFE